MSPRRILVAPSMLAANFGRLAQETQRMETAGADWIHLDVMDGHFVPNLTMGSHVVASLRPVTKLPLDVHLMVERPQAYVSQFVEAGADRVTFHAEAVKDIGKLAKQIRGLGAQVGVALCPATPMKGLTASLEAIDLALLMTVHPGFGGQAFIPDVLPKIESLRKIYDGFIQVDGGINHQTASSTRSAGADVMVAGTYVFRAEDPAQAIASLRGQAPAQKGCKPASGTSGYMA
jgi:ribulose-phosphate 3-epimerase